MLTDVDDIASFFPNVSPNDGEVSTPKKRAGPANRPPPALVNYKDKTFMVIDDQPGTRQSLRLSIQNMGGGNVAFGTNYSDAIFRLKNASKLPDIILCDYNLEDGRDGQQLFEEIRKINLILDETVFIMVTAERSYANVISVAELAPDDYILKPFTPDRLQLRLDRVVARKEFLRPYYQLKRSNNLMGALQTLDELLANPKGAAYRFEIMRHRAETFLLARRGGDARTTYESILDIHPFPWAKLGLARALAMVEELGDARTLLDEVISENPTYFTAFDLKADVCRAQGDYGEAQKTLQHAAEGNPKNWDRKKVLADTAMLNGDSATARAVMADVLKNNTMPGDTNTRERLNLARLALQDGDAAAAMEPLTAIPAAEFGCLAEHDQLSILSLLAAAAPEAHGEAFEHYRKTLLSMPAPSVELGLDVARAGLSVGDLELATRIATTLLSNKETRKAFKGLLMVFAAAGHEPALREVQRVVAGKMAAAPPEKRL